MLILEQGIPKTTILFPVRYLWAIVHRVTKNWTWLSGWACTHAHSEWCSGDSDPDNYIPVSKPGVLRFMGSQRVGHDSATELNWTEPSLGYTICTWHISLFFFLHLFSFSPSWIATYSAIDLFTSGKVGAELPGVCAPICWLLECWSTEGFTIPQSPTRLDRDPLWCGGDCWGGGVESSELCDLGERLPTSFPSFPLGGAREASSKRKRWYGQSWREAEVTWLCKESLTQKQGRVAGPERAQWEGSEAPYSSLRRPKPHSQHRGSQRPLPWTSSWSWCYVCNCVLGVVVGAEPVVLYWLKINPCPLGRIRAQNRSLAELERIKICGTSQVALVVKNPAATEGDTRDSGLIPGLGRFPGGGHGNPLQYSCLDNPLGGGVWRATVHRVTKSRTRLKRLSTHMFLTQVSVWTGKQPL